MNVSLEARNTLVYLGTALLPPMADAVFQYLQSRTTTGQPIDWGQVLVIALMAALAAYVASQRPKVGHETQAALIDSVGHAAATTVLAETVAAQIGGVATTPFTPAQIRQIAEAMHGPVADELEARMQEAPAPPPPSAPGPAAASEWH